MDWALGTLRGGGPPSRQGRHLRGLTILLAASVAAWGAPDEAEIRAHVLYVGPYPGDGRVRQALREGGYEALMELLGESTRQVPCKLDSLFGVLYLIEAQEKRDRFVRLKYHWDHPHLRIGGRTFSNGYFRVLLEEGMSGLVPSLWRLELRERIDGPFRFRLFHEDQLLLDELMNVEGCR